MNDERIETLVKKYVNDFFLPSVANAQILRNALTEQAETHAGELKAYDHMNQHLVREVEIMSERIRQLEAERPGLDSVSVMIGHIQCLQHNIESAQDSLSSAQS